MCVHCVVMNFRQTIESKKEKEEWKKMCCDDFLKKWKFDQNEFMKKRRLVLPTRM